MLIATDWMESSGCFDANHCTTFRPSGVGFYCRLEGKSHSGSMPCPCYCWSFRLSLVFNTEAITKELFLLVIQDRCVQRLMDELDLPPDRANLFEASWRLGSEPWSLIASLEAIDADGSGTLHVTELVQAPWPFRTKGSVMLDLSRGSRGPLPGLFVSVYCLQWQKVDKRKQWQLSSDCKCKGRNRRKRSKSCWICQLFEKMFEANSIIYDHKMIYKLF